jgi:membrane protease YdiL (CAAX protease family)
LKKQKILLLASITLLVFGGGGLLIWKLILNFQIQKLFSGDAPFWQMILGTIEGIIAAFLAILLVSRKFFRSSLEFFKDLIHDMKLNWWEIIFISLCAGIGEEIFFRGVVQYWLGIWITALVFVLLHGYLNPKNIPLTIYGIFMVLVIAGLGFLKESKGLITAIVAHTWIDILLLAWLSGKLNFKVLSRI